jgi:transcription regulator (contains diacylglycerol kinase catalytic domain)
MLNVANTRQFGNNAFIAPNAILDDGLVDIVLVKRFSLIGSVKFAYQLFSKKLGGNPFVIYLRLEQIDLEIDNNIWHIDGDAMELPSPVEIQVLKHSLKVLK